MDEIARCAGPGCTRSLTRLATGRPRRYCGDNCRQQARRAQVRAAEAERLRLIQLAEARAAAAAAALQLEQDTAALPALAARLAAAAAGADRSALSAALTAFAGTARRAEVLARRQFDEAGRAALLGVRPAIPGPGSSDRKYAGATA